MPLAFDPIEQAAGLWEQHFARPSQDMAAVTSIMRVAQLLQAAVDRALRPCGLSFARYEALVLLTFARSGALPMATMGQRLMLHPASVTGIVDRLERDQLVSREPHPTDRRTTLVRLTPAAAPLVQQATAALHQIRFGLPDTPLSQLQALTGLLREVRMACGDFTPAAGEPVSTGSRR